MSMWGEDSPCRVNNKTICFIDFCFFLLRIDRKEDEKNEYFNDRSNDEQANERNTKISYRLESLIVVENKYFFLLT